MIPQFSATSTEFTPYLPSADNFIGGAFVKATGSDNMPVMNPRYGRAMSHLTFSTAADVDAAVRAAQEALPAWRDTPMRDRAYVLYRARSLMLAHLEELTWLVSHENGKVYGEARAEVEKAIECLEYGCSLPNIATGQKLEVSRGVTCEVVYEPLGVVAGIVPFNFPLMVPMWMIPQALVGGNAFVLKPSERVPLATQRLAAIFTEAGLPPGVFSIVQGGRSTVEAICDHPGIKAVGFVGSTAAAKAVYSRSCATGKRALCLGGAKNYLVLAPDADPTVTIENVVASFTGCAGQRCMAAAVLLAIGKVDHVVEGIVARAARMELGKDLGPIITPASVERITSYITGAEKAGAKVLLDGRGKRATPGGNWVGVTVLDQVRPEMPAACEEIFGPVLSIVRVPHLDAAMKIENASPYGNAACVYTSNGAVAAEVMRRAQAGMCGVNVGVPVPREPFAFGGWNDSRFGAGDMTGWDGFRFWTQPRKVTTKWSVQKDTTWMG